MRPRHLLHLDERGLTVLAAILYVSERAGLLPVEGSNIILLPKPTGGERPIGLLPTIYRVWCRCRRPVAAEWERMRDRKYFWAASQRSSEQAVHCQGVRQEHARSQGLASAGLLADCKGL